MPRAQSNEKLSILCSLAEGQIRLSKWGWEPSTTRLMELLVPSMFEAMGSEVDKVLLLREFVCIFFHGNVHRLIHETVRIDVIAVDRIVVIVFLAGQIATIIFKATSTSRVIGVF